MKFLTKYGLLLVVSSLLLVNVFIWQTVFSAPNATSSRLKVTFLDVGQGDAIFIEAPNGNQLLIDGGRTDNKVLAELGEVMGPLDHSIDVLLATHPDADHIGGFPEILSRYEVSNFLESGNQTKTTAVFKTLENVLTTKKLPRTIVTRGMRVILDEDAKVYLDILYPDRSATYLDSNEASIFAKLSYLETCFIFSGDAPQKIEYYVAQLEKENLQCEVLKAGHHGSRTSTSNTWVGFINPEYAVISDGKNNSYGHPHQETLNILEKFGAKVLRTDLVGRIEVESDGQLITVK